MSLQHLLAILTLHFLRLDSLRRPDRRKPRQSSIIRAIANWLPLAPAKRLYFQPAMLGGLLSDGEQCESDSDSQFHDDLSLSGSSRGQQGLRWMIEEPLSLADVTAVVSLKPNPCIQARAQVVPYLESGYCTPDLSFVSHVPQASSTPEKISEDPDARRRITELEEEVKKLQTQLSSLLAINTVSTDAGVMTPVPQVPPPPPCPSGPPPPPPPPPPLPGTLMQNTPQKSVFDIIKENKLKKAGVNAATMKEGNTPRPDMGEVLKNLGKVKLKKIPRSPGGTPLRQEALVASPKDHASIIANALKRKFSKTVMASPESGGKRRCSYSPRYSSVIQSSSTPPGPHLLKSSMRRQFKHSYTRSPMCSPLSSPTQDSPFGRPLNDVFYTPTAEGPRKTLALQAVQEPISLKDCL